jgi:hypothetical protein
MSCTSTSTASSHSAWSSASRWVLLPLTLAAMALLTALRLSLVLYGMALRKRTPQASTRAPERPLYVPLGHIPPSMPSEPVTAPSDDDWDPDTDDWCQLLDNPHAIASCVPHLEHCLTLDPARHDH